MSNLILYQLTLNLRSPYVQSMVRDPYRAHQTMKRLFPGDGPHVLFRLERTVDNTGLVILALSTAPMEVQESMTYVINHASRPLNIDRVVNGRTFQFRLKAHPQQRNLQVITPITDPEGALSWLRWRAERIGC